VLMLGLNARVEAATVNGTTLHRVRVGPFKGLDDMNQARSRLGSEKIETSVVRQ
jgi:cell division protein FtsN